MMMLSGGNTSGVGVGPQPAAANPLREKVRMEVGITGIANIPNQVHYLASHTQVDFNILLMGELSLGKTELINRILGSAVFENTLESDPQESNHSLMTIRVRQQQVVDDDVRATIRLIDAPQVGHSVRKGDGYRCLCDYAKDQLRDYLMWEMDPKRVHLPHMDNRIHVCLYLLSPHQRELSDVDVTVLKSISTYTSVIPIVSKADMLTDAELNHLSERVLEQCRENSITLFEPSTTLFATSRRSEVAKGLYRVETELIRKYLPRLISDLESLHYERCRTSILQELLSRGKKLAGIPSAENLRVQLQEFTF